MKDVRQLNFDDLGSEITACPGNSFQVELGSSKINDPVGHALSVASSS